VSAIRPHCYSPLASLPGGCLTVRFHCRSLDRLLARPAPVAGWLLVVLGAALAVWALAKFRAAGTTISPSRPASTLVTHGPFRLSRNPMYLGLSLLYLGVMLLVNSAWPLLLLPFVIAILHLTVIRKEERYLSATFGIGYDEYRRRVRRWL
jgi:protein-S-isoprenylcysteine O-methyltransferase Ste14